MKGRQTKERMKSRKKSRKEMRKKNTIDELISVFMNTDGNRYVETE